MKMNIARGKYSYLHLLNKDYPVETDLDVDFDEAFRVSHEKTVGDVYVEYPKVKYDSSLWRDHKFINILSHADTTSGWGNATIGLIKNSKELQIALAGHVVNVPDMAVQKALKTKLQQTGVGVWHDQPRESWYNSPFSKNIAIVPFETTRIPASWISRINQFDALFVPCKQNIEAFIESGVTVPIELIHWGVDPKRHSPITRQDDGVFTFGTMGALSSRKGTDLLVDAFKSEFRRDEKVQLICKTSSYQYPFWAKDKRVIEILGPSTDEELRRDFYSKVDTFVFPTRGEGFGLPPLEAMATGIPVIATGWSGITEFLTEDYGWLLKYRLVPATAFSDPQNGVYKEDCGMWAEPDRAHLQKLMRYAYEHQDEAKQKGKAAAEYVQREWLWNNKIKMFHDALDKHL